MGFRLESERLTFRPWISADLEDALSLWGNPEVMAFLSATGPFTKQQVEARLQDEIERGDKFGVQYWRVSKTRNDEFVGCCGLRPFVFPGGRYSPDDFEVGFHLMKTQWGKGYASEAAKRAIRYGFEEMKLSKLLAGHHPDNLACQKVLEKLNFKFIRTQLYEPTGLQHPIYELKKEEMKT